MANTKGSGGSRNGSRRNPTNLEISQMRSRELKEANKPATPRERARAANRKEPSAEDSLKGVTITSLRGASKGGGKGRGGKGKGGVR